MPRLRRRCGCACSQVLDQLDPPSLNSHLSSLMPGLTAKVFRTYNASETLQNELPSVEAMAACETPAQKVLMYNEANKKVAILCNHQRTVSKAQTDALDALGDRLQLLKRQKSELKSLGRAIKAGDSKGIVLASSRAEERIEEAKRAIEAAKQMVERAKSPDEKVGPCHLSPPRSCSFKSGLFPLSRCLDFIRSHPQHFLFASVAVFRLLRLPLGGPLFPRRSGSGGGDPGDGGGQGPPAEGPRRQVRGRPPLRQDAQRRVGELEGSALGGRALVLWPRDPRMCLFGLCSALLQVAKRIEVWAEKIRKLEIDIRNKDDNKEVALGTSKINYCDPRISIAWCKRSEVAPPPPDRRGGPQATRGRGGGGVRG